MTIRNALASLAVRDLATSATWYRKLFGRAADSSPMPEVVEWKFEGGGWLQVYEREGAVGGGSVTLSVTDLDAQIASLRTLGIDPGEVMESGKARVVMIKDPDGNSIAFAEAADAHIAQ